MADTRKRAEGTDDEADGFTAEERAAMKERTAEVRAAKRRGGSKKADPDAEVLAKIAEMPEPDRSMAERIHVLVRSTAPELVPRTWYGMPAYSKDGKVLCFFQGADKFKARYATLGFNDTAVLDDGPMWATSFAIVELTDDVETRIVELVKAAAG
jgi:uncharacterized protein YdhG (YjbR/CyaY superfamily)